MALASYIEVCHNNPLCCCQTTVRLSIMPCMHAPGSEDIDTSIPLLRVGSSSGGPKCTNDYLTCSRKQAISLQPHMCNQWKPSFEHTNRVEEYRHCIPFHWHFCSIYIFGKGLSGEVCVVTSRFWHSLCCTLT